MMNSCWIYQILVCIYWDNHVFNFYLLTINFSDCFPNFKLTLHSWKTYFGHYVLSFLHLDEFCFLVVGFKVLLLCWWVRLAYNFLSPPVCIRFSYELNLKKVNWGVNPFSTLCVNLIKNEIICSLNGIICLVKLSSKTIWTWNFVWFCGSELDKISATHPISPTECSIRPGKMLKATIIGV